MKTCYKCKEPKSAEEFGERFYCRECHRDINREWARNNPQNRKRISRRTYLKNKDTILARSKEYLATHKDTKLLTIQNYRSKYPKKYKAHGAVCRGVKSGKIVKKPCGICGNEKVEAHHDDYSKPLDVKWYCTKHHKAWHRVFVAENPL